MTKKGPFFGPQNVKKAGAQKWASPVAQKSGLAWYLSSYAHLHLMAEIIVLRPAGIPDADFPVLH